MSTTLGEIDKLKHELDALQPLKPEAERKLWKKLRLEWNYNSNHIEGNTLTYGETELLLIKGRTTGDHDLREYEEMKAHDLAVQEVREWATDESRDLTETDIRQLNKTILKEPFWKEAITEDGQPTRKLIKIGEYKEHPNSVRLQNGEIFHYPSPEETPAMMHDLMKWYEDNQHLHPIELAALFHYKFVCIHPFDDGNGRVARLVMNYILMKAGYMPVIIKSKDKAQYLNALNKADIGELNKFVEYIQDQLPWSFNLSIKAAKGESIDEMGDLDKEIVLLKKELSADDALNKPGSVENIVEAIHENIFPLFMMLEEKSSQLHEYFFDFDRSMKFEIEGQNPEFILGSKDSDWQTLRNNWLFKTVSGGNQKLKSLKYDYTFKGLKKTVNAGNLNVGFNIVFSDYNYSIQPSSSNVDMIRLPYGKKLTNEELYNFYSPLLKELIDTIKRFSVRKK